MKKLLMLAVLLVLAATLSTSAFAWSTADLVQGDYYWLKYNGMAGDGTYYTTFSNLQAAAINVSVDDAVKPGAVYVRDTSDSAWLGSINTFCIDLSIPFATSEHAAKYMKLSAAAGASYLLNKYGSSDTNFAWNAALQAAVWKAIDPTHDYQLNAGTNLGLAQGYYTNFVSEISNLSGYGLTLGFNGNDPINKVSQNVGTGVVPEASTLVGFGSALAMAGPGLVGWLRRRRA